MTAHLYPPGPRGLPFLGNLRDVQTNMMPFLASVARDYGDIAYVRVAGRHLYLINHPTLIREMLVQRWEEFTKNGPSEESTPVGLRRYLGNGLLTNDGPDWKRQRKLMQPAFHAMHVRSYGDTMVQYGQGMVATWQSNEVRDIAHDLLHVTMQIAGKTLFGIEVGTHPELDEALVALQRLSVQEMQSLVRAPGWLPTPMNRRHAYTNRMLDTVVAGIIAERHNSTAEEHHDLLAMLMQARYDDGTAMDARRIRDEVITLFVAGHETTANTLTWLFYLVSQHPEVEARLHAELDQVLAGRFPTVEDLGKLPYVKMIVQETLRLYPVAHLFPRMAARTTEFHGYPIKAGSMVLMSPYILHRDARFWPEPYRFDPERFNEENEPQIDKHTYLPFGGGPRVCIGNSFAMMEAQLLVAVITQSHRLVLAPEQVILPEFLITTRPKNGLRMQVVPRTRTNTTVNNPHSVQTLVSS